MRKKYISLEEIDLEIKKTEENIDTMTRVLRDERKRAMYLCALAHYLYNEALCPLVKKEVLNDMVELQHFVLPICYKLDNNSEKQFRSKNYGVNPDTIGLILHDFIDFVCEFKGHKIGVGEALIRRFIKDKVEF